ncbi:MAG: dihydrodipicolinate synthase family protein [Halioglobus sp.]
MKKINGMICAPFSAFNETGDLNLGVIPRYTQMLVDAGILGVFINGSSGEGHLLTNDERSQTTEAWIDAAPEGFKVIVHVGSNSIRGSREMAEHARKAGAWGTGVMGPTFPRIARPEELVAYCEQIARGAPDLPFYYYHIPFFSHIDLPMLPFLQAVDGRIENFAGIKYTFESLYEYTQCRRYKDGKFDLLHGQDETLLASLALGGASGSIGGTFNYAAGLYRGIIDAFNAGDMAEAQRLQFLSMDVIDVICRYRGNIVGGKQIMKLMGLDLGRNRAPFQNLSAEELAAMQAELDALDFFNICNRV